MTSTTLAQVLADIEAAAAKVAEARSAIIRGDREAAIHSCRRVEYNALNASLLIRSFSDQAFPAACDMISTQRALRIALAALGDCTRAAQAQNAFNSDELSDVRAASDELSRMLDASKTRDSISVIHGCTEVQEARP